jgi:hypothetical protein
MATAVGTERGWSDVGKVGYENLELATDLPRATVADKVLSRVPGAARWGIHGNGISQWGEYHDAA